jgi:hypothetical protein
MGVCMRGGESKRGPPCGCAVYMWICGIVCVVAIVSVVEGERESEREGRGRGGGERERNNPSSKPLDKHSTPIDRHYEARRYDSSIHPGEKFIGVGWIHQT